MTDNIYNGTDMMLAPMDMGTNHADLTTASDLQAARTASHHILYTIANSRAVAGGFGGLEEWQKLLVKVDVVAGLLLVVLEILAITKYRNRKKAEVTVQEG